MLHPVITLLRSGTKTPKTVIWWRTKAGEANAGWMLLSSSEGGNLVTELLKASIERMDIPPELEFSLRTFNLNILKSEWNFCVSADGYKVTLQWTNADSDIGRSKDSNERIRQKSKRRRTRDRERMMTFLGRKHYQQSCHGVSDVLRPQNTFNGASVESSSPKVAVCEQQDLDAVTTDCTDTNNEHTDCSDIHKLATPDKGNSEEHVDDSGEDLIHDDQPVETVTACSLMTESSTGGQKSLPSSPTVLDPNSSSGSPTVGDQNSLSSSPTIGDQELASSSLIAKESADKRKILPRPRYRFRIPRRKPWYCKDI